MYAIEACNLGKNRKGSTYIAPGQFAQGYVALFLNHHYRKMTFSWKFGQFGRIVREGSQEIIDIAKLKDRIDILQSLEGEVDILDNIREKFKVATVIKSQC